MEFLVEFQVDVPEGTPDSEVERRERAEAAAAANLARERHLARLWKPYVAPRRSIRTPNDPTRTPASLFQLPDPLLTPVYRLEATGGRATRPSEPRRGRRPQRVPVSRDHPDRDSPDLDWLNKGIFNVTFETYLVG